MVNRKTALKIRKTHRYLGLFLGIQFLMWTISGLYFSWTDIDEIHGDEFLKEKVEKASYSDLISPSQLKLESGITELELREIAGKPFYWVNKTYLYDAVNGEIKNGISKEEAVEVANGYVLEDYKIIEVQKITNTDKHHEYRKKPLPAYVISYDSSENIKAYVSERNGRFESIRHRDWRWFDFLWMMHTMDYEGRYNFNTIVLRAFSLLGLITVLSGFLLWYTSSPSVRKTFKKSKNKRIIKK